MTKHIKDDKIVTETEIKKLEKDVNKHAEFWVKITKAGEKTGQIKRIKSNLITIENQIPILSGTSKDHKEIVDEEVGPDLRPIMGAMIGPNVGIANFASMIVRKVAEVADVGHVAKSTEETINKIENYNKNREILNVNNVVKNLKVVVGSMDIIKWYPRD